MRSGRIGRSRRGGNLRASSKVEDAAVVDRDVHQFGVAFVVEAPCEDAASPIWLADDLDRSDRLLTDSHVDVMHQEVSAGEHFVDVGADDGDRWFTDHMAGRNPTVPRWRGVACLAGGLRRRSCHLLGSRPMNCRPLWMRLPDELVP